MSVILLVCIFVIVSMLLGFQNVNASLPATTIYTNEGTGFLDNFSKDMVIVVGAVGSAATASALYFIWKQTRMTQKEIDSTLRPWLGISDTYLNNKGASNEALIIHLKNYGKIPAEVKSLKVSTNNNEITRHDIENSERINLTEIGIFPEQPPRPLEIGTGGNTPTFIGFSIEYGYSKNRKGNYAVIQTYDLSRNIYRPTNEWFE